MFFCNRLRRKVTVNDIFFETVTHAPPRLIKKIKKNPEPIEPITGPPSSSPLLVRPHHLCTPQKIEVLTEAVNLKVTVSINKK